jgi:outer membrane protein OmpA-like peptidoglycan-associated protein
MLYLIEQYWIWLAVSVALGLSAALLSQFYHEKVLSSSWLVWGAPFFAAGLAAALANTLGGRPGLYLETALLTVAAYFAGGVVGTLFGGAWPGRHKGWWVGLIVLGLIWIVSNIFTVAGIERDVRTRSAAAMMRAGGNSFDLDVVGRDVLLPVDIGSLEKRTKLADIILSLPGIRLVSEVPNLTGAAGAVRAEALAELAAHKAAAEKAAQEAAAKAAAEKAAQEAAAKAAAEKAAQEAAAKAAAEKAARETAAKAAAEKAAQEAAAKVAAEKAEQEAATKAAAEKAAQEAAAKAAAEKAAQEAAAKAVAEKAAQEATAKAAAEKAAQEAAAKAAAEKAAQEAAAKAAAEKAAQEAAAKAAAEKAAREAAAKAAAEKAAREAAAKAAAEKAAQEAAAKAAVEKAAQEAAAKAAAEKAVQQAAAKVAAEKAQCQSELSALMSKEMVVFKINSPVISDKFDALLAKIKAILAHYPLTHIEVSGHTDSSGAETFNKPLSLKRAQAGVDYLVKAGIDANRLLAVGYASSRPLASNSTRKGRSRNRRIEFAVK